MLFIHGRVQTLYVCYSMIYATNTSHHVEETDTIQEATQEAIESSDKRSAKPLRPPGNVELDIIHMPPHLQDKDPMWSGNEMRLLQKSDHNTTIPKLRTKPIMKTRILIPLCSLKTNLKVRPIIDSDIDDVGDRIRRGVSRRRSSIVRVSL